MMRLKLKGLLKIAMVSFMALTWLILMNNINKYTPEQRKKTVIINHLEKRTSANRTTPSKLGTTNTTSHTKKTMKGKKTERKTKKKVSRSRKAIKVKKSEKGTRKRKISRTKKAKKVKRKTSHSKKAVKAEGKRRTTRTKKVKKAKEVKAKPSLTKKVKKTNKAEKKTSHTKKAKIVVAERVEGKTRRAQPTVSETRRIAIINQIVSSFSTNEDRSKVRYRYKYYNMSKPEIFSLKDARDTHIAKIGNLTCFAEGTNISLTQHRQSKSCVCTGNWWGKWCSFSEGFKSSLLPSKHKNNVKLRDRPRRVILGTPFNMEFEMMEARLDELGDIVDLYLISESSFTAFGDRKPRNILNRLRHGYLLPMQDKIVYVAIKHFPSNGRINGWLADNLPRHELGLTGLRRQVNNSRSDDLIIISDTDEIPSREAILFLKMHDGYPEPFGFNLKWTTYGFYWQGGNGNTPIMAGCSIGMMNDIFKCKAAHLRSPDGYLRDHPNLVNEWKKKKGNELLMWKLGNKNSHVGWHCSWCFSTQMAQIKLVSAQNGDFPRWGDQEKNLDINYLKILRAKGQWFDNSQMPATDAANPGYAPRYFTKNPDKYPYLMRNVYKDEVNLI